MSIVHDPIQAALDLRDYWTPSFAISLRDARDDEDKRQLCIDFVRLARTGNTLADAVDQYLDRLEAETAAAEQYVEPLKINSWEEAVAAEPRLAALEERCEQLAPIAGPSNWRIYSAMKKEWSKLVGWHADRPEMRDSTGYDVVLDHLVDVLGF